MSGNSEKLELGNIKFFIISFAVMVIGLSSFGYFSIGLLMLIVFFQLLYFLMTYYKGLLFILSIFNQTNRTKTKNINLKYYPSFNILLPNYKEKEQTIQELLINVAKIKYPSNKINGFLIAQEDDYQTIESIKKVKFPSFIKPLIIPPVQDGEIQSKSRALNYGLKHCQADIITIFDSEDEPDPDQFIKVAHQFSESDVSVIQCNIDIYNTNQNFFSRFFAAEFRCFFQFLLKGISSLKGTPFSPYLPLGGTSFYVKKEMMQKIGEFDMFNPTEDLIFSASVYKNGGRIEHCESITYGEAPIKYKQLLNQRTRWVKGFLISMIVMNKDILKSWKSIGFIRWITFNFWTMGSIFGLTAPFLILFTLSWLIIDENIYQNIIPNWLWAFGYGGLLIGGSLISVIIFAIPAFKNGRFLDVLLTPIFILFANFILVIAAYKAIFQLITKPNMGWVKTEHGLAEKDIIKAT